MTPDQPGPCAGRRLTPGQPERHIETIRRMATNAAEVYGPDDQRALALTAALDALTELDEIRTAIRIWVGDRHTHLPPILEDRLNDILNRRAPTSVQETLG